MESNETNIVRPINGWNIYRCHGDDNIDLIRRNKYKTQKRTVYNFSKSLEYNVPILVLVFSMYLHTYVLFVPIDSFILQLVPCYFVTFTMSVHCPIDTSKYFQRQKDKIIKIVNRIRSLLLILLSLFFLPQVNSLSSSLTCLVFLYYVNNISLN